MHKKILHNPKCIRMKNIVLPIFLMINIVAFSQKKMPSVALHYSFTDFKTAMNIQANNLNFVLKNGQWSNLAAMDAGYGISYWQGLTKNLDINAGLNYTKSIYTFPVSTYTVTKKMFTVEAAGVFKFLAENKTAVTPYLSAGIGLYSNDSKTGFYAPLGLGVHANLWHEAFVFIGASYRVTFANNANKSFFYHIGVGTHLIRRKEKKPEPVFVPPVVVVAKPVTKDVMVWVKDEATSLPLPGVEVKLTGADGKIYSGNTDDDGRLTIMNVAKNDYGVSGELHGIITESKKIEAGMFDGNSESVAIILLHNDPRFTLVGKAVNKKGGNAVADVEVTTNNISNATSQMVNTSTDGMFKVQLAPMSDFTISGKKAGYFSNIENVTTKGLNRSTTLYVKLELEIQEAKQGQQFVLNNIYFETNKALLNTVASTDLDKLVKYLQDNSGVSIEIQGHTDSKGSAALNNRLSQNRAISVLNYLVAKGIAQNRLAAKGYGSTQPVATNATAEGRANNRRVEVKVLKE